MSDIKADTGTTPYAVGEKVDADDDVEVGASAVKSTPTPAVNPIILSGPSRGTCSAAAAAMFVELQLP